MAAIVFSILSFLVLFVDIQSMNISHSDADNKNLSTYAQEMDEAVTTYKAPDVSINASKCIEVANANIKYERVVRLEDDIFKEIPLNITFLLTASSYVSNCTSVYVLPECYETLPNGSVYVPEYNRLFNETDYVMYDQVLFVCPMFSDKIKSDKAINEQMPGISLACVIISTVCLLLYTVVFIAFKEMRNLPGYCMQSLTVSLLAAYACYFIVHYAISNLKTCTVLGMFLLYFLMSSFFWMHTISYDVWKSIRLATAKLRLNKKRPVAVQFARYSLYAWGSPLIVIIISIIVHYSVPEQSKYRLASNVKYCWFAYKQAFTIYFAGPIIAIFCSNIFFFVSSFYMISEAASTLSRAKSRSKKDLKPRLLVTIRLGSVMGFMWLSGITATLTNVTWLWYFCTLFRGLQGVCILFNFTVTRRLKKAFRGRSGKFSRTLTSTSSIGGTSFHTEHSERSVKLKN